MQVKKEDAINILMIEDLRIAQIAAVRLFEALKCNVDIVSTAAEALGRMFEKHYDIIFIDIQLPDINGFLLAKEIRNIQKRSTTPLIAVTANSNEELEARAKDAGFDGFLLKPLTIESIRHVLFKNINKAKLTLISSLDKS